MQKIILLCGLVSIFSCRNIDASKNQQLTLEERKELLSNPSNSYIMVAAHRGDWRNYPENSIAAIESAIKMGVDIVEVDVQKTKDGVFILLHDTTLDRTTNATGKVSEYTYEELKQFTLRHAHMGYSEEPIPTLKEALLSVKGKVLVDLDKAFGYIEEIVPILKETGTLNQVLFPGTIKFSVKKYNLLKNPERITYMAQISDQVEDWLTKIHTIENSEANPKIYEVILTNDCDSCYDIIREIRNNNDNVWINSMYGYLSDNHWDDRALKDPEANWGYLIEKGATILQTDRPLQLIQYLNEKGFRCK